MFRIIRVPPSLEQHVHWDHKRSFQLLVLAMAFM